MAIIKPFKGLRYNNKKIKDLSQVVTPPYDVISEAARKNYYKNSKYNIVRLILGNVYKQDNIYNNKYTRAAEFLNEWQDKKVLIQDKNPSLYIYAEDYIIKKEYKTRCGFFALFKLSDYTKKEVFPHERIFSKPKEDRLLLLRTCKTNFSPIFGLYSETDGMIGMLLQTGMRDKAVIDIKDEKAVRHRLWQVHNKRIVQSLISLMKDKKIFIADGHHRYNAALEFSREMHMKSKNNKKQQSCDYVMMYFLNMEDKGVTILPTYRVVRNVSKSILNNFLSEARRFFTVETLSSKAKMFSELHTRAERCHAFGVYLNDTYHLLTLHDEKPAAGTMEGKESKKLEYLDVTILHKIILQHILHVNIINLKDSITYTSDEKQAVRLVQKGGHQIAFFLNPTTIHEVRDISQSGGLMPQKSTYFYPKLLTGLVMNIL